MPRTARAVEAGGYYHVLNRGNGRMDLFHKPADFNAFVRILPEGLEWYQVDLLAWCLMHNHWHLVLRPGRGEELGRLMGWVCVTHVRRHHAHYHTGGGGHLYQGRFKSFPVQDDRHFLMLCRYVEANPVRAGLVDSGREWPWSSLHARSDKQPALPTIAWPVKRPANWLALVDRPMRRQEADAVRLSMTRGRPLGDEAWTLETAHRLALDYTLRPRGRPRVVAK